MTADVDLSVDAEKTFNVIGQERLPFAGVFDGNGHTISNFNCTSTSKSFIGLFGVLDGPNAEIRNLGMINTEVDAGIESMNVGTLVGLLRQGTITCCYAQGGSVSGMTNVGGLVGENKDSITNCYSMVSVPGDVQAGGRRPCGTGGREGRIHGRRSGDRTGSRIQEEVPLQKVLTVKES